MYCTTCLDEPVLHYCPGGSITALLAWRSLYCITGLKDPVLHYRPGGSCTELLVDNPGMLFKIKNPSVENLLKIQSGMFFPADNGHIYAIPDDKRWIFGNQYSTPPKNTNQQNDLQNKSISNHNQNQNRNQNQYQNTKNSHSVPVNARNDHPKPVILQTKPLCEMAREIDRIGEASRLRSGNTGSQSNNRSFRQQQTHTQHHSQVTTPAPPQAIPSTSLPTNQPATAIPNMVILPAAVTPQTEIQNAFMSQLLEVIKGFSPQGNPQLPPAQSLAQAPAQIIRS